MPGDNCIRAPLGAPVLLVLAQDFLTASKQKPPVPEVGAIAIFEAQARPLPVEVFYRCHSAEAKKVKARLFRVKCRDCRLTDVERQLAKAVVA
jgi:hypothetical protein